MTIVRFNNHMSLMEPFDMLRLFSGLADELIPFSNDYSPLYCPSANIRELPEAWTIDLAVPGYEKSEFTIETEKNILKISAEKKSNEGEGQEYTHREFAFGNFTKSFVLPRSVDVEKISAGYANGILTLILPKNEDSLPKPPRQIEITW